MATTNNSIHVLHVDDEPGLTKLVADFLEREDDRITVDTATSASEGLDRVTEGNFDCIVSDYDMPGQNGIEFLETLREEFPHLPFILYTGKGSEEVASDAISAGATDYLQKGTGTDQYELLANRIQNAVEQSRAQQRATELERIRTLVNDVNQALIRSNSRSEVETRVCEIIAGSDPYLFAWIGEENAETDQVEPRTWGGVEEGYLEEVTLTTDKTATGRGPTGTAIRERRVTVSQKVAEDPDFTWQEAAVDRGYRAMAAVPLEYGDKLYGGLNVYADRPDAFNTDELEVLTELGDDIGHAIHAEEVKEDLERAQQRAEQYFETAGNIMVVLNRDGTVARINERGYELLGYERSELVGSDWIELTAPEETEDRIDEILFSFWEDGADPIFKNTNPIVTKDGKSIVVKWHNTALRDQEGNVTAVLCSGIDITERKNREIRLQETTARLKAHFENSPDMIDVVDSEGIILEANQRLCEELGYEENELLGTPIWELDQLVEAPEVKTLLSDFGRGERRKFEGRYERRDESTVPVEVHLLRLDLDGEDRFLAVSRNISGRKERERELKAARAAFQKIIEASPMPIWVQDDEEIFYSNDAAAAFYGYDDPESLIGNSALSFVPENEQEGARKRVEQMLETGEPMDELTGGFIGKNGTKREAIFAATPIMYYGEQAIVVVANDITELKEREEQLQREKERLDEFAGVVSHDLRNPLNVAQGRIELAQKECDTSHLDAAADGIERSRDLIEDLLALARGGKEIGDLEAVEANELVQTCWNTVNTAQGTVDIEIESTIRADRSRLRQLFENLFRNAVQHGGKEVTVSIGQLPDGFYLEDNGSGIPADERENVFEPGYSESQAGSGFGLSIVKQIVEAHGWDIQIVEGSAGGARFEITGVDLGDG